MSNTQTIIELDKVDLEEKVKFMYENVAQNPQGKYHFEIGREVALKVGYPEEILNKIPEKAIESFAGVGYFFDFAQLQTGDIVLDLGSGSGMDLFFASLIVGATGKVIGIDITKAQINKASDLAKNFGFNNVFVKEAYIEDLPFADNFFDVVISNGVINLSPDKEKVFKEISRVLKHGGRLAFADIISMKHMPEAIVCNATLWASCIGGATQIDDLVEHISKAGLFLKQQRYNKNYKFLSNSSIGASETYGVQSHSFLVEKLK